MITYRIIKKCRLIYITTIGIPSLEDHLFFIDTLRSDNDFSYEYDIINDSRMLEEALTKERTEQIASYIGSPENTPKVKHAIVASDDMSFGMSRMFEMLSEHKSRLDTHVFRDMDEALAWLGRTRSDIEEPE